MILATDTCPMPPPPPPPPPHPYYHCCGDDVEPAAGSPARRTLPIYRASLTRFRATAALGDGAGNSPLGRVTLWLTHNEALGRGALEAIVGECQSSLGGLTSDCRDSVSEGAGNFRIVPPKARAEFVKMFDDVCQPGRGAEVCLQKIREQRTLRSLARARLDPQPLTMNEGVRIKFTARLRDSGRIMGVAGGQTDQGVERDSSAPGGHRTVAAIPYSEHMCFILSADDPDNVKIEPAPPKGATLDGDKQCMDVAEGGAEIKYEPSWFVTPQSGDDLKLLLNTEYEVERVKLNLHFQPRPILVDVIPKPSIWDWIDAFLKRATVTTKLAIGLATAIGALFTAIAGWKIWGWIKRRRSGRRTRRAGESDGS